MLFLICAEELKCTCSSELKIMNRFTTQYHDNLQLSITSPSSPHTQYDHTNTHISPWNIRRTFKMLWLWHQVCFHPLSFKYSNRHIHPYPNVVAFIFDWEKSWVEHCHFLFLNSKEDKRIAYNEEMDIQCSICKILGRATRLTLY